jgi:uncharacterized protein (TIGR03067 family)
MAVTSLVEVQLVRPSRTSTFQVVAGAPRKLDLTTLNHFDQTRMYTKAIYKLEKGRLTYCVGAPGQPRPTAFATSATDGNTLVVLKRKAADATGRARK